MTENPTFCPMTPGELRGVLADLSLSNDEAARLIGVATSTLAHWLVGSKPVPIGPAVILLRLLRADPGLAEHITAVMGQVGSEGPPRPRGRPVRPVTAE